MIKCNELKEYTKLDCKIEKLFGKLDLKLKKKAVNGGNRLTVVIYDHFTDKLTNLWQSKSKLSKTLYDDYVIHDPDIFMADMRSQFMYSIQQKLIYDYGYPVVSWDNANIDCVDNSIRLTVIWG
jgi:hypothetical protein